jgi:thiosulfate/3-mercaptopyruvate sulfurtransferase
MRLNHPRPIGRLVPLLFLLGAAPGYALQVPGPLVDTEWLANNLDQVVVIDVRRDANSFIRKAGGGGEVGGVQACGAKGAAAAVSGHIPGSALVEWKDLAVKQKVGDKEIYDQVPDKAAFEKLMQQSGVNADSAVVVVNPGDGAPAVADGTRLYWNLKYYGMDNVAVLDGGVAKWAEEKRKIEYGRAKPGKGNWQATAERQELLATLEEVQAASGSGDAQILDVRTPDYYLGLLHKSDKVAAKGHIPGAKNLPFILYIKEGPKGSTFYSVDEIKRVAQDLGIDASKPTITQCNTGHLSSSGWFVMHELLGNQQASTYDGSMNEWAADPARPVSKQAE